MPIGKEKSNIPPEQSDPTLEGWVDLATSPATDPQDFLKEDAADVNEIVSDENTNDSMNAQQPEKPKNK